MNILKERLITNHLLLDYLEMWDEFDIKTNSDNDVNRYHSRLIGLIMEDLDKTIDWLKSDDAKNLFVRESEYQLSVFNSLEEEWDEILEKHYDTVDELLTEVYDKGKKKGYSDMISRIKYTKADKWALDFVKDYNFGLIQKLDDDLRYKIKNKIISGFLAGDHPYKIAPKIAGLLDEKLIGSNFTPNQRATMIARTEISRVQNTGILQSYVTEGYVQVKILTAEDNSVCYLCLKNAYEFEDDVPVTYDNKGDDRVHYISDLIKNLDYVPLHPNCRCTYLSVWETKKNPEEFPLMICLFENPNNPKDYLKLTSGHAAREYNRLKKDKSIKISFVENEIEFEGTNLRNDERFFKYEYPNGLTIYKSIEGTTVSVSEIYNQYIDLPKIFRESANEIILSSQHLFDTRVNRIVPAYVNPDNIERINILSDINSSLTQKEANQNLVHELAHCFDGKNFEYSNSRDYIRRFYEDYNNIKQKKYDNGKDMYTKSQRFSSSYSYEVDLWRLEGIYNCQRVFSEDFAEAVRNYFLNPIALSHFDCKYKYLNNIFKRYPN